MSGTKYSKEVFASIAEKVPDIVRIGEDAAVTYPYLVKCKRVSVTKNCFTIIAGIIHPCCTMELDSFSDILATGKSVFVAAAG